MGVEIRVSRRKIYLDVYMHGQRRWEPLGLSITPDKQQSKEIMKLAEVCRSLPKYAEVCRSKREAQIVSGEWNLIDELNSKQTLSKYLESINKGNNVLIPRVVKLLNKHNKGNIALASITEKWLEDIQYFFYMILTYLKAPQSSMNLL